jgi:peptidyl-prolyl cis-trans isomerase SurA
LRRPILLLIALALVAGPVGAVGVSAQELADRIVAVVDEDPIFLSDIEFALAEDLYIRSMRGEPVPEDSATLEAMKREVLESTIDRRIVIVKARSLGVEVTRTDVEDALDQWLSDMKASAGSEAAFMSELERQGLTIKDLKARYRKDIEEQLLVSRFMRNEFSAVDVTENEIRSFYETKYDSIPGLPEVVGIAHIIIMPRVPGEREDRVLGKVDRIMDRIRAGEDFGAVAREMSEDALTSDRGGAIGAVELVDLKPEIADIAVGLGAGEVSDPIRTKYGIEIVKLDGKDGETYRLSHIFVDLHPERADTLAAADLAAEVRSQAVAGESFEVLARQYSDDADTKDSGGYVGEIEVSMLDDSYRTNLEGLAPGEVSDVIGTKHGFQILKLVSRTASRKAGFDEARNWIRNLLEARHREALFTEWLDAAREDIYIKRFEF